MLDVTSVFSHSIWPSAEAFQSGSIMDVMKFAAKALAAGNGIKNIVFTQMEVTPENASLLPKTDMVICLSIFHHWIRKLGQEKSFQIMKALADSTNKYFVFDSGQPNEKNVEWNECLEFMNPDIEEWAEAYFKELGFSRTVNLGDFRTSLSKVPRTLFIATKDDKAISVQFPVGMAGRPIQR